MTADMHTANWTLTVFSGWQSHFSSVEQVLALLESPAKVLHENSRGAVYLIHDQKYQFIAKRSKRQEHRPWLQFSSLYRGGESARAMHNIAHLHTLGLPVPEPVLILEKTRHGCVTASWSMYCYIEGRVCTCTDAARIAETLKQIHHHGWVHRDPHVKNFLLHHGQIAILDCARARPWKSRRAQMYDVVLLNNCCPGSVAFYGISETDGWYQFAKFQNNLLQFWRKLKRLVTPWRYRDRIADCS